MVSKPSQVIPSISEIKRAETRGNASYMFGRAVYAPCGWYGPRRHNKFLLLVMLQGSVQIECCNTVICVEPGNGVLMQPGHVEFYRFSRTQQTIHTWCQLDSNFSGPQERKLLQAVSGVWPVPSSVHMLLNEGLATPLNIGPRQHLAARSLALTCILHFAATALNSSRPTTPRHLALDQALNLLATKPAAFHSAGELAKKCGISFSRLRQLFRMAGTETPSAMLWRLKTQHAVQILCSTGLTLAEVADQCGFANPFHLSRCIKARTGFSPRELRKRQWST